MSTGSLAFKATTSGATCGAILNKRPTELTRLNPELPEELEQMTCKALEKERGLRYQNASDLKADLARLKRDLDSGKSVVPAGKADRGKEQPSIAVLPFVNFSQDPENDYFSDGLAEELINALMGIEDLRIAARTSAFNFKGSKKSIPEIGKELNVATVLEGSVRKAGNRLRITAQLINVANGYYLWSEHGNGGLLLLSICLSRGDYRFTGIQVPFQSCQIRFQVGSILIAQPAFFLQGLTNHLLQFFGQFRIEACQLCWPFVQDRTAGGARGGGFER